MLHCPFFSSTDKILDSNSLRWMLVGGILAVYLAGFLLLSDRPIFWSPDEGGKYLDMHQITISHRMVNPLPYPGHIVDPTLEHVPLLYWLRDGDQLYSWWPVWFPAISSWAYRFLGFRGVYLIPLLSSLLLSITAYHAVSSASKRLGSAAMAVTALASPIAFYGFTFWEHTLQSLLVFWGFLSIVQGWTTGKARWYATCGFAFGLASYLRFETTIWLGAVGVAEAFRTSPKRRARSSVKATALRLAVLVLCFLVALVPLAVHNHLAEGHVLGRRNALEAHKVLNTSLSYGRTSALDILPCFLFGTSAHGSIDLSVSLRWMFVLATIGCSLSTWLINRNLEFVVYLAAMALIALCSIVLFAPIAYISVHGLVLVAPYVAFAGWHLGPDADQETHLWRDLAGFALGAFLLATFIAGWKGQGGLQWGPRYALPLFPLLIVTTARGAKCMISDGQIDKATKRVLIGCLLILILLGFGFQARGWLTMFVSKQAYTTWEKKLETLPEDSIITTDLNWLALTVPDVYETRVMLLVDPETRAYSGWRRAAHHAGFKQECHVRRTHLFDIEIVCSDLLDTQS
jgi:hypothetical protein